jgi:selenium-binding protein 1
MVCSKFQQLYHILVFSCFENKSLHWFMVVNQQVVEPEEMVKAGVTTPHTAHCLPSGNVMISCMGDANGNGLGEFVLINAKTGKVTGLWTKGKQARFGYDFWYQPYFDVMLSSEWGAPYYFRDGYVKEHVHNKGKVNNPSLHI